MFAITRAAIRDCHEEKCTYRSALLGWAMLGMFLFRRGSVNALDAQHPIGSAHPSWLREVSGLPPDEAAEAPCGDLLRYWAGRLDAEAAAEPLRPSRLSCYGRWHLTVVACKEISPMPYDGRFVTDLPCPDATAASRIATCGRKRWWIESQNQTQKHLSYGLKHNYRDKSNASKVCFVFLLLATPLWEVFYKLGLRHWQPDTREMPE